MVYVSDTHVLPRTTERDLAALTDVITSSEPDMILLGGDYADDARETLRLFDHFRRLRAALGLYACVGNNDREAFPDLRALRQVVRRCGISLLVNESVTLPIGSGRLTVAGLDEYRWGHPDCTGLYPNARASDHYRVLLSHYPILVSPLPDLMLSGHTHGGQFNLLGLTPYALGFERIIARRRASRYIAGLHEYNGSQTLVSKGIGASRIPLRIGVQPELLLITFV